MTVQTRPVKRDRSTTILLALAGLVAVGGIAFAVGRLTAPPAANAANTTVRNPFRFGANASLAPGQTFAPGQGGLGRGLAGGGVEGTVASINGSTMTITLANGSTATVDLTGSTTYHRAVAGASTDVTPGSTVRVQVQFNGTGAGGAGGGAPAAGSSPGTRTFTASDVTVVTP